MLSLIPQLPFLIKYSDCQRFLFAYMATVTLLLLLQFSLCNLISQPVPIFASYLSSIADRFHVHLVCTMNPFPQLNRFSFTRLQSICPFPQVRGFAYLWVMLRRSLVAFIPPKLLLMVANAMQMLTTYSQQR